MRLIFIISILLFCVKFCLGQADTLISKIIEVNEVHHKGIGYAGSLSDQYSRFLKLSNSKTLDELIGLTKHENLTVRCYAAWGLIDKDYKKLDKVFIEFQKENKQVTTFSGCLKYPDPISSVLYHRYWKNTEDKKTDKLLLTLDSLILYNPNSDWLLTLRALENRLYPRIYNPQIEYLAFKQFNNDALFYLSNWYKAEYKEKLKNALLKYLNETNFEDVGTGIYYKVVSELLAFRDEDIEQTVIEKLKKDKHWIYDKEKFLGLLDNYSIYGIDKE